MPLLPSLEAIEALYATRGHLRYGEGVTQIEHALQCATLAEAAGATPSLVIAALLHDVGHLLVAAAANATADDRHEVAGAGALKGLFGPPVLAPIALHVAAKRYLCFKELGYARALSPTSLASLALQGGAFNAGQAAAFERHRHSREAVSLRRFDDEGKVRQGVGRAFTDFLPVMRSLLIDR